MEKIEQECYLHMEETDELFFLIYQANLYHAEERFHQRDICIERIRKHTLDQFAVMDVFDELYEYSKMLFDIGRYQEFLNMVKVLETPVKHANLINLQRKLISLKLEYYKLMQEREKYLMEAGIYYQLYDLCYVKCQTDFRCRNKNAYRSRTGKTDLDAKIQNGCTDRTV